jgi:hypothetical protein
MDPFSTSVNSAKGEPISVERDTNAESEFLPGRILHCSKCERDVIITRSWLTKTRPLLSRFDAETALSRLRCKCGARGLASIYERPNRAIEVDELVRRHQKSEITSADFDSILVRLADEGEPKAFRWIPSGWRNQVQNGVPILHANSTYREPTIEDWSRHLRTETGRWFDFDLGIVRRPGRGMWE